MDYFSILDLAREPFSNSPDPEFFFHSRQHQDCLQKLELSLLLRRGLNVVIGDVGTGKTTLCRQLIRRFAGKQDVETHLVLDPYFLNASEFLATVTKMFCGKKPAPGSLDWQVKEHIKQHLFRKGVDDHKTVVLIIDEGQKIPAFCLEILREFLNYETNEFKLLQIVIFAQKEFEATIRKYPNFADRINLYHQLKPLSFRDTRLMIKYRLEKSSNSPKTLNLFTRPALWAVYRITSGYPRKIINLCHQSILSMIIQNRSKCGYFLVRTCARRVFTEQTGRWKKAAAFGLMAMITAAILVLLVVPSSRLGTFPDWVIKKAQSAFVQDPAPAETFKAVVAEVGPPAVRAEVNSEDLPSENVPPEADMAQAPKPTPATGPEAQQPLKPAQADPTQQKAAAVAEVASIDFPAPEAVRPAVPQAQSSPLYTAILGRMTLQRDETLSRIIQKVYGGFNSRYFKSFILANPDIEDPDRVEVGQRIWLPAIPARVSAPGKPIWWVKVAETDSLESAFNVLRRYPDSIPPLRLVPYWSPQTGMKFAVVLKQLYKDKTAAAGQMELLPAELSSDAMLASLWDEDAVYFADPFFGRRP
jgi:general secretion pathway protein A